MAGLNFERAVKLGPQRLKLLLPFIGRRQLQRSRQLQQLHVVVLLQQHRLMHRVIDEKVLFREPPAKVGTQQGQDVVFGVDDRTQHPAVLLEPDKALKLVHFPVKALFHLVQRSDHRVPHPLHRAGAEGKGQMQKPDE